MHSHALRGNENNQRFLVPTLCVNAIKLRDICRAGRARAKPTNWLKFITMVGFAPLYPPYKKKRIYA